MKKTSLIVVFMIVIIAIVAVFYFSLVPKPKIIVTTFEECISAGNPVMESYPRQCRADGKTFIEHIGNEIEKSNLIRLTSPRPGQTVRSPLTITGEARGNWFFEASFPIMITNWDGIIIGEGFATAEGEWMTTDFVPFKAVLNFNSTSTATTYSKRATLILKKDNPSDLPEHDDALEVPVVIE